MSSKFKYTNSKDILQTDYVHRLREENKQKKMKNLQIQDVKFGIKMRSPPTRKTQSQNNVRGLDSTNLSNIQKLMEMIYKNQIVLIQTQKPLIQQVKNKIQLQNSKLSVTQFQNLLIQTIQNIQGALKKSQEPVVQEFKKALNYKNQSSSSFSGDFNQQLKQISENISKTLLQSKMYLGQIKRTFESLNSRKGIEIKERIIEKNEKNSSSKDLKEQISYRKANNHLTKSQKTKFEYKIYMSEADPKDEIIDFSLDDYEYLNYTIVRQFLVQVYERILSKSHYNYIKDVFSKQDTKNYCTKNILYNVKKVLQLRSLWNNGQQIQGENLEYPQQKIQLTIENLNKLLKEITDANLRRYPQKIASGVSQRVLQVVPKTNLLQSDQYDFLFLNKINIVHNSKPNYFSQIMETINKMIQIPTQQIDPLVQSTYFDIFREVLNVMIIYSTSQVTKQEQNKKIFKNMKKQKKQKLNKGDLYSDHVNRTIQNLLVQKLKKQLEQMDLDQNKINQKIQEILKIKVEKNNHLSSLSSFQKNKQDELNFKDQDQKNNKNYYQNYLNDDKIKYKLKNLYANSKISSQVKKFTQSQVQEGELEINDSTILRILTKWTEQLQEKFKQPQNKILKRTEPFKNNEFGLTDIQEMEAEQNELYNLITNVLKEKNKNSIQKFMQVVKQQNNYHQQFFGEEAIKGIYINDLASNISLFGAKMQKFSGHYILNYLNFLMHQLTEVPSKVLQNQLFLKKKKQEGKFDGQQQINLRDDLYNQQAIKKIKNINLVTLKIGDLMRGKYSCSQAQFIRLVNIMENFSKENPSIVKIIRVKNRLESKDNDILMNILFMNKIQCEFQLSLSSDHSLQAIKQKKTNQFNHYLYEISRSLLGPISELTGILIQEDPLTKDYFAKNLVNFKKISFFPVNYEKYRNKQIIENYSMKKLKENQNSQLLLNQNIKYCKKILPFQCQNKNCRQITLLNNDINFDVKRKICLECSINELLKKDKQNRKQKGFALFEKFTNETQALRDQKKNQQFAYEEYFEYFDHANQEIFQKAVTKNDLLFTFPKVGCFINIKQKKPQIKLFSTYKLNQQIFVFSPNEGNKDLKALNKKGSLNFEKVKILGKFKFSDKQQIKSFSKTIPKTQVMWGFKNKILEQDTIKQLSFINNSKQLKLDQMQLKKFKQNLVKTINLQFMENLLLQRKSNVNINRFAKMSNKVLDILFKHLKKDVSYIKQFRANKSIVYQDQINEQSNTPNQIQSQKTLFSNRQIGERNSNNKQVSWLNGFLTLQRLDIRSNNMTKISLEILLDAKSENLKKIKYLDISSNKIGSFMPKINFKKLIGLQILKCLNNGIQQVQSLQSLKQLKQVDLSKNKLSSCQFIKQNIKLTILELSDNKLRQISCLKNLTKLQKLNLKSNNIQDIEVCRNLVDLKGLNLEKNYQSIRTLQHIKELKQLEHLNIKDCIKASDISLEKCVKLKSINLENSLITNVINKEIINMKELKQISLSYCKRITYIQITQQTTLKWIDLTRLNLNKITISNQQSLEELYLKKCFIKKQGKLQNCGNLRLLSLDSFCENKQFKLKVKNCKNIKKLDVRSSTILQQNLEQILSQQLQLQQISLSSCKNLYNFKIKKQQFKNIKKLQLNGKSSNKIQIQELSQLQRLSLGYCRDLSDIKIKNCKNIKILNLASTKINQSCLQQILTQLPQIQQLCLESCSNLQKINIKNCKNIKKLDLNRTKIKESDLQQTLQNLPCIQLLDLNGCQNLQNVKINNCRHIKRLNLSGSNVLSFQLEQLSQIQQLCLQHCNNLQNIKIKNCKNIKKLNLNETKVKQSDLQQILQQLLQLQQLHLYKCSILQSIKVKNCKNIKKLQLSGTKISKSNLQEILQLPLLQDLNLYVNQNLQDYEIKNCKSLKKLTLSESTKHCYLQQLLQLENLYLSGQNLQSLKIKNCKSINKLELNRAKIKQSDLEKILQQLPQLQHLKLSQCQNMQKMKIKNCKSLRIINLEYSKVKQYDLQELPQLQWLGLNCSNLQNIKLKNCINIKTLNLNRTNINQSDLQEILKYLSQLQQLYLENCQNISKIKIQNYKRLELLSFSSGVIKQCDLSQLPKLKKIGFNKCSNLQNIKIKNCKIIQRLDLSKTKVEQSDVEQILQQLPEIQQLYLMGCKNIQNIKMKKNKRLRILSLKETSIKQCHLQQLPQLENLSLQKCLNLEVIKIKNCKNIKKLNLTRTKVNQSDLKQILSQLSQLEQLNLIACQNFQTIKIKNCKNLKKLELNATKIKQCHLQQLQQLQDSCLYLCENLENIKIKNCKSIKKLNLNKSKIKQSNLEQILKELPQLQQLDLSSCVNFQNIKMENCQRLKTLTLNNTLIKQCYLQQLQKLQILNIFSCSNLQNIKIINCKSIKSIGLSGKIKQQNFQQIIKELVYPQYIKLNNCEYIQSLNLKQLNYLQEIHLQQSKIKKITLQQLPQLKKIDFQKCQFIQQIDIKNCKEIKQLNCRKSNVLENQKLLEYLKKQLPGAQITE